MRCTVQYTDLSSLSLSPDLIYLCMKTKVIITLKTTRRPNNNDNNNNSTGIPHFIFFFFKWLTFSTRGCRDHFVLTQKTDNTCSWLASVTSFLPSYRLIKVPQLTYKWRLFRHGLCQALCSRTDRLFYVQRLLGQKEGPVARKET